MYTQFAMNNKLVRRVKFNYLSSLISRFFFFLLHSLCRIRVFNLFFRILEFTSPREINCETCSVDKYTESFKSFLHFLQLFRTSISNRIMIAYTFFFK